MKDEEFILYEGDFSGVAKEPVRCSLHQLERLMGTTVKTAKEEGRTVRITDTDDFLVFHAEGGRVIFPTPDEARAGVRNGT